MQLLSTAGTDARPVSPGRGIGFMILATALFSVMNALVKWLGPDYPTIQLLFFRNLFAMLPVLVLLWRVGAIDALRTHRPLDHLWRALVGLTSAGCFFYALANLPFATVIAISFAAPLFVTAFSVPLLGEYVGPRRWAAVVVGFAGVLWIVRPGAETVDLTVVVAVVATVLYALVMIFVRRMNRTESPGAIVFYYLAASVLITGCGLPFVWVAPDVTGWLVLVALGVIGGLAQIAVTMAFRFADAAVIAPFDYVAIVWTSVLGFAVWGEVPASHVWTGLAVVIASGLYIAHREARLRLRLPRWPWLGRPRG